MISSFNLDELSSLLKDYYIVTHIRITVFNDHFEEIASYPQHRAAFCQIVHQDPLAAEKCRECDNEACRIALKKQDLYIYQCHAGLMEAITPIRMGNITIGYLFFGHIFSYPTHEIGWEEIQRKCSAYNLDLKELKTASDTRPIISKEYVESASHLLNAVANYLCIQRMAMLKMDELPMQIDSYIMEHLTEPIDVHSICNHFQIGKTRLYEIARQSYGIGIAAHIRHLRIEKAKSLLEESDALPISEIAYLCGFNDYNYFITVFKRETSMSPLRYQKKHPYS